MSIISARSPARSQKDNFARDLERFGAQIALRTADGVAVSYADLAQRSDVFAARLGDRPHLLLIAASNEIEPIVALMAALRHGHCALLTAPGANHEAISDLYRPSATFAKAGDEWRLSIHGDAAPALHPDLAVLLSTSGSTGSAKLVRLSRGALDANARSIAEYLGITPDDRPITTLPIHYSYGLSVLTSHLAAGAGLLLNDRSVLEPEFWDYAQNAQATSLAGVPYVYELLERINFRDGHYPHLKTMTQAGGRLAPETAARYADWAKANSVDFFVMYGQTEATARMAYMPPDKLAENPGAIGVAIPGGAFRLVDEAGLDIDRPGVVGELVYRGPNVMMGYARDPADLSKGAELTELFTGDLATRDTEGLYTITGRKSRFSKLFGLRIGLDDVETAMAHRGLAAFAAGDDELLAVAVLGSADEDKQTAWLAERFAIPTTAIDVAVVSERPLLASGKTDYAAILRSGRERKARQAADIEATADVISLFRRTFPRGSPTLGDTFVSLDGDSLSYVTLSMDIETLVGFLPQHWEETTIRDLQDLADNATVRTSGWWQPKQMETEVIVRAAAITAVVTNHATNLPVGGGSDLLLLLYGYNLARYQKPKLLSDKPWSVLQSILQRVIIPYYGILLAYEVYKEHIDLKSLLMVSNFYGRFHSFLEPFWFMEDLIQMMVVLSLVFMIPAVKRLATRDPWVLGMLGLGAALAIKIAAYMTFHHGHLADRTPDATLYLVAMGWTLHAARTPLRKGLTMTAAALIAAMAIAGDPQIWHVLPPPSNFTHGGSFLVAIVLILSVPVVRVPLWARASIGAVAAASFYIYLTHGVPVHILSYLMGVDNLVINLSVAYAIGLGAAAFHGWLQRNNWFGVLDWLRARVPGGAN